MKNFIKNNGQWIRIFVISAAVIFAAGKICNSHSELCRKVETKVNKEIFELENKHRDEQLKQINEQLKRIEGKVDAIITHECKTSP
jgi:hypothetical protein